MSLVKGQEYELCQSLELAFNSRPIQSEEEFWCNTSNILEPPLFPQPIWNEIDITKNLDLAREIFLRSWLGARFRDADVVDSFWEQRQHLFNEEVSQGVMRIEVSNLDFNFDGQQDRVYRYTRRVCPQGVEANSSSIGSYHILDEDDPILGKITLSYFSKSTEAFFFRGRTYLLSFQLNGASIREPHDLPNLLTIAMVPICEFEWE
ncbi:hypothetical protein [Synechococcus sp. PCC 7336]|uniref:hypothetical protein n=1 Tax=Synechococcus sp. PCC 7336 TaxID=195250 RepID=UPI0012EA3235|nr:hypothetical protein [Synechococcus sp. PCC 7336]